MSSEEKNTSAVQKEIDGLRETLKQVGYQNQMMLNRVKGAVITVDRKGRVNHANEAVLQALDLTIADFIGLHMHETIHHSQDDSSEYP